MDNVIKQLLVFISLVVVCYSEEDGDRFYYFAYGSNLLGKRLLLNNPTAVFFGTGYIENHRLDFNMYAKTWRGAVATIVEEDGSHVWGALWTIEKSQMSNLDKQEGVDLGWYFAKNVTVIMPDGRRIDARTYQETTDPPKVPVHMLRLDRKPSLTYHQVITEGALDCGLPEKYMQYLHSFPTNGNIATAEMLQKLGFPFDDTHFEN